MMYGLGAVLVAVLYMSLFLVKGFQELFAGVPTIQGFAFLSILQSGPVDVTAMSYVILAIVVVHAAITGFVAKASDGGNKYGAITHFVLVLWIAAGASVVTQFVMQAVF